MRKTIIKILSASAVFCSLLAIKPVQKVDAAEDAFPLACAAYEVDTVSSSDSRSDNGTPVFNKVNCYTSFNDAKSAMKANGDNAVVRHVNSKSPMKIIAMNGGLAYSYPGRSRKGTENIYSTTVAKASTYMPAGRELYYLDTKSYNEDKGTGTIEVEVTGFHGTTELLDMDLIPFAFAHSNVWLTMGGNNSYSGEQPFRHRIEASFYQVEQNGNYKDLVFYAWNNKGYPVFSRPVGPAAGWMSVGSVYYSSDDVNFYTDTWHRNKAGTYYNFYEFVPLRTKSSILASAYNTFLSQKGYGEKSKLWNSAQYFIDDQNQYGINAAMVFSQAVCESAYGMSNFAQQRNNLFGVNAVDSNPNQADSFDSVKVGIDYQMNTLLRGYMSDDDWRFYGTSFGNKGTGITVKYASSIYYGITLAAIYYEFDKYASGNNGSLTEPSHISVGVVSNNEAAVYADAAGTKRIHNFKNENGYVKNATVSILGETGNYYMVQSQNYLTNDGKKMTVKGTVPNWDWDRYVVFIKKSDVNVINDAGWPGENDSLSAYVYRLYNQYTGEHLFTTYAEEYRDLASRGWIKEGKAWSSPKTGDVPVYRLYNPYQDTHLYTTKRSEYDYLITLGWKGENISFYSASADGTPVYRMYNPYSTNGLHLFTTDENEYNRNQQLGWIKESIEFYGLK